MIILYARDENRQVSDSTATGLRGELEPMDSRFVGEENSIVAFGRLRLRPKVKLAEGFGCRSTLTSTSAYFEEGVVFRLGISGPVVGPSWS